MVRRQPERDDDNPDRWLVSYADFITLLFAFFVVMYAISSVNQKKYEQLSSAMNNAFIKENMGGKQAIPEQAKGKNQTAGDSKATQKSEALNPELTALQHEKAAMTALGAHLSNQLAPLINDGKIRVAQNNRGIRIDINESLLFTPGSASLARSADAVLGDIAKLLLPNGRAIQVEGHTDNIPIHNGMFYSNWELSAVRASSVVRKFIDLGIGDFRLSALGYGATHPLTDNDTPESRAQNRRVSVMILYESSNLKNDEDKAILPQQAH